MLPRFVLARKADGKKKSKTDPQFPSDVSLLSWKWTEAKRVCSFQRKVKKGKRDKWRLKNNQQCVNWCTYMHCGEGNKSLLYNIQYIVGFIIYYRRHLVDLDSIGGFNFLNVNGFISRVNIIFYEGSCRSQWYRERARFGADVQKKHPSFILIFNL